MMRRFMPPGIRIYVRRNRRGEIVQYSASIAARGRRGAATRAAFAALPGFYRQHVLEEWAHGRFANLDPWAA